MERVARAPIGYRLRERRRQLGMTQTQLAEAVGISPSYANLIEHDKRTIGGGLLANLARVLGIDLDTLTGAHEARLIQTLAELSADPLLRDLDIPPRDSTDLVSRFPQWSRGILALYRALADANAQINDLAERLNQDSFMMDISHQILTHITSIRSSAEILRDFADLSDTQREQFLTVVSGESDRLAGAARSMFEFFRAANANASSATPTDEVDDFLIDNRNYFPTLERLADELRARVGGSDNLEGTAWLDYLAAKRGVTYREVDDDPALNEKLVNGCWYDSANAAFLVRTNLPHTTRRFQAARLIAELEAVDAVGELLHDERLRSDEARTRAARALTSYLAGAMLFPYDAFHAAAVTLRYDIGALAHRFGGSFEQICHRLVTLRRTEAEGIPFAFMRTDPAGNVTKRFSIPGLTLPRYGSACPLWAIYRAMQTPEQTITQLAAMPDDDMYLFIARSIVKQPPAFGRPATMFSIMLCCESIYAGDVVLADGLDPSKPTLVTPVGSTCRLCPRTGCDQRAHPPVFSGT